MTRELPAGLNDFLGNAGWDAAQIEPLPGDASFRRYFRIRRDGQNAMLMDAPPPHEDPRPFIHVGKWLAEHGLRAPTIYAEDAARGLVLMEDFGNDRMRDWLDDNPAQEHARLFRRDRCACDLAPAATGSVRSLFAGNLSSRSLAVL